MGQRFRAQRGLPCRLGHGVDALPADVIPAEAIGNAGPFEVDEVRLGAARFHASGEMDVVAGAAIAALAKAGFTARVDA